MADGPEQIIADIPCITCGYNLRMQPTTALCPECREPVPRTLHETSVRWGPRHLRYLGTCALYMAFTALTLPGTLILFIILILLLNFFGSTLQDEYGRYLETGFLLALNLCIFLHVLSIFAFTQPPRGSRRSALDWLICLGALLFLGTLAAPTAQSLLRAFYAPDFMALYTLSNSAFYDVVRYLKLTIPLCLLGPPLYAILGAQRIADIYRRSGMAGRGGFARWSLRLFAGATLLFDGVFGFVFTIEFFPFFIFDLYVRLRIILVVLILGTLAIALLAATASLIALFLFASRLRTFAATVEDTATLSAPIPAAAHESPSPLPA